MRALSQEELTKLDNMVQDVELQNVRLLRVSIDCYQAGVRLKYCPFCPFKTFYDEEMEELAKTKGGEYSVLKCENPACKKQSCLLCDKENHLPRKCFEVVSDLVRKQAEEALTSARVRHCRSVMHAVTNQRRFQ